MTQRWALTGRKAQFVLGLRVRSCETVIPFLAAKEEQVSSGVTASRAPHPPPDSAPPTTTSVPAPRTRQRNITQPSSNRRAQEGGKGADSPLLVLYGMSSCRPRLLVSAAGACSWTG